MTEQKLDRLIELSEAICKSLAQIERVLLTVPKATARTRNSVAELRREMKSYMATIQTMAAHKHV